MPRSASSRASACCCSAHRGRGSRRSSPGWRACWAKSDEGEQYGALLIDGVPAARARGRAGLVMQDPDAQVILSRVGDDVAFGCENLGVPARRDLAAGVGCARRPWVSASRWITRPRRSRAGRSSGSPSPGLLAMRPGLLLLDEPTANLDPAGVGRGAAGGRLHCSRRTRPPSSSSSTASRSGCRSCRGSSCWGTAGCSPTVRPRSCSVARGRRSPSGGVWVPGIPPAFPPRAGPPPRPSPSSRHHGARRGARRTVTRWPRASTSR